MVKRIANPMMAESSEIFAAVEQGFVRLTYMRPILDVTEQRCHQLAQRDDFPSPAKMMGTRRLWLQSDLERWRAEAWPRARRSRNE